LNRKSLKLVKEKTSDSGMTGFTGQARSRG
jgi:hypothetical protein